MSILFFKKPAHVPTQLGPLAANNISTESCANAAIPADLSFENVICNNGAPPCSLQDFLNYLIYIEHNAENLQFYLWMVDYHQRFRNAPEDEKKLSRPWKGIILMMQEAEGEAREGIPIPYPDLPELGIDMHSEDISSATSDWDGEPSDSYTETNDPHLVSMSPVKELTVPSGKREVRSSSQTRTPPQRQPFRAEMNRIVDHYLVAGGPRELNLTQEDRLAVLQALRYTTHPSAFNLVKQMLDSTLRNVSHPNFVRWSTCNGSKQWTIGLRVFAITNITIGFLIATLLTLSRHSRYWRIFAALEWWFGITNLIAASQGLCVLLHRMHSRQHLARETTNRPLEDDERMLKGHLDIDYISYEDTKPKWPVKMEVFGPANDYGGEDWVRTYPRTPWYRKLFEKRVAVKDRGLRSMQDRMVRQAEAWALLITIPLTVVFCSIPPANLF